MGKQTNILSFDEVKRGVGTRRSSVDSSQSSSQRRGARAATSFDDARTSYRSAGPAAYPSARRGVSQVRLATPPSPSTGLGNRPLPRSSAFAGSFESSVKRSSASKRQGSSLEETFDDEASEVETAPKRSRFAEFRRKRQKDRAGKKFSEQFDTAGTTSDASSGPRAAVYKGEMGATHKRAARMHDGATGSPRASAKRSGASVSDWKSSPKFIGAASTAICLVLVCCFLYVPAQQFYQSVREHDRLQAEYFAIEQRNDSLQSEVSYLATDAGVEDRARKEFGWVAEGHETANVRGLSTQTESNSSFTANIRPGSIEAPQTWYSPVLDVFFGIA